jgi:hypothetical protein
MKLVVQIISGLVANAILIIILSLLGMFVWNMGVTGLIPTLDKIAFSTASAIMTGIVILNMFIKIWYKRISHTKQEKELLKKFYEERQKELLKKIFEKTE